MAKSPFRDNATVNRYKTAAHGAFAKRHDFFNPPDA
jgi:hypothetical protein